MIITNSVVIFSSGGGNDEGTAAANSVMHASADGDRRLEGQVYISTTEGSAELVLLLLLVLSSFTTLSSSLSSSDYSLSPPSTGWSTGSSLGSSSSSSGSKSTIAHCESLSLKINIDGRVALEINFDLLEERREEAAIREAKSKAKMEKYYNAKVRNTSFKPGDLVYRNNDASRAEDTGKLGPKWEGRYEVTEALGKGAYKLKDRDGKQLPWN
ncbi:hypothetical protein Tco_1193327 [Tanacetum coccineum]